MKQYENDQKMKSPWRKLLYRRGNLQKVFKSSRHFFRTICFVEALLHNYLFRRGSSVPLVRILEREAYSSRGPDKGGTIEWFSFPPIISRGYQEAKASEH